MKKTFMTMAGIAMLAAGIAFFASCEKDNNDNGLTTNVQPKLGIFDQDPEELPNDSILFQPRLIDLWHLYWREEIVINNEGERETILLCTWGFIDTPHSLLCGVSLNKPQELDAAFTTLNIYNRRIKNMVMDETKMDSDLIDQYIALADEGTIEFAVDCPITDEDVLELIDKDYIPAGKYPIYRENSKFTIVIEE